jgi:hypothetical protein
MFGIIIDPEVEVEYGCPDRAGFVRSEMDDVHETGECPPDMSAGGVGSDTIIQYQGIAVVMDMAVQPFSSAQMSRSSRQR